MTPGAGDASFWGHVPAWMWPIILTGILGFFLFEAIKTSESVAGLFGRVGRYINNRGTGASRLLKRIDHIEHMLQQTDEKLEVAVTYLVIDADWHHTSDMLIAENNPTLFRLLPKRMPYTDFYRRWQEGWRPA